MGKRRYRRPVGRPRKVVDENVQKTLLQALRLGVPISLACQAADIAESSFYGWMQRGYDEHEAQAAGEEPDEAEAPYLDLFREVKTARADAAVRNVGVIQKAAQGGTVTEETKETLPDGTRRETVKRSAPDWRAAAWYLERSHRNEFGKGADQVEVTGKGGGPIEVTADAEDLSRRLAEHLAAGVASTPALEAGEDVVEADYTDEP